MLDVLQSVPILPFLPVVLLGLTAILPQALATELAAIVLIFTSRVWNMTLPGISRCVRCRASCGTPVKSFSCVACCD